MISQNAKKKQPQKIVIIVGYGSGANEINGSGTKVVEQYILNDFLSVFNNRNGRIFRLIEIDFTCHASRAF